MRDKINGGYVYITANFGNLQKYALNGARRILQNICVGELSKDSVPVKTILLIDDAAQNAINQKSLKASDGTFHSISEIFDGFKDSVELINTDRPEDWMPMFSERLIAKGLTDVEAKSLLDDIIQLIKGASLEPLARKRDLVATLLLALLGDQSNIVISTDSDRLIDLNAVKLPTRAALDAQTGLPILKPFMATRAGLFETNDPQDLATTADMKANPNPLDPRATLAKMVLEENVGLETLDSTCQDKKISHLLAQDVYIYKETGCSEQTIRGRIHTIAKPQNMIQSIYQYFTGTARPIGSSLDSLNFDNKICNQNLPETKSYFFGNRRFVRNYGYGQPQVCKSAEGRAAGFNPSGERYSNSDGSFSYYGFGETDRVADISLGSQAAINVGMQTNENLNTDNSGACLAARLGISDHVAQTPDGKALSEIAKQCNDYEKLEPQRQNWVKKQACMTKLVDRCVDNIAAGKPPNECIKEHLADKDCYSPSEAARIQASAPIHDRPQGSVSGSSWSSSLSPSLFLDRLGYGVEMGIVSECMSSAIKKSQDIMVKKLDKKYHKPVLAATAVIGSGLVLYFSGTTTLLIMGARHGTNIVENQLKTKCGIDLAKIKVPYSGGYISAKNVLNVLENGCFSLSSKDLVDLSTLLTTIVASGLGISAGKQAYTACESIVSKIAKYSKSGYKKYAPEVLDSYRKILDKRVEITREKNGDIESALSEYTDYGYSLSDQSSSQDQSSQQDQNAAKHKQNPKPSFYTLVNEKSSQHSPMRL